MIIWYLDPQASRGSGLWGLGVQGFQVCVCACPRAWACGSVGVRVCGSVGCVGVWVVWVCGSVGLWVCGLCACVGLWASGCVGLWGVVHWSWNLRAI